MTRCEERRKGRTKHWQYGINRKNALWWKRRRRHSQDVNHAWKKPRSFWQTGRTLLVASECSERRKQTKDGVAVGRVVGRTDGQADGRMEGRKDRRTDNRSLGWSAVGCSASVSRSGGRVRDGRRTDDGRTDGRSVGLADKRACLSVGETCVTAGRVVKQLDGPTYVRMGGLTVDWIGSQTVGGQSEGRKDGLQTCGWVGRSDGRPVDRARQLD